MAIEKKSLISNRATVKKAVLATNATKSESITSSPAKIGKVNVKGGKFATIDARRGHFAAAWKK